MFYEGHTSRPSNPTRAMYPPQASSQPGLRPVTRVTQRLSSPSRSIVTPQWGYQSNLTHAATVPQWGCTKWYQPAPSLEQRTTASSDISVIFVEVFVVTILVLLCNMINKMITSLDGVHWKFSHQGFKIEEPSATSSFSTTFCDIIISSTSFTWETVFFYFCNIDWITDSLTKPELDLQRLLSMAIG